MATFKIVQDQLVHTTKEALWKFISNPDSLEKLTPNSMGGRLLTKDNYDSIVEGMKATYLMKPLRWISVRWEAQFTEVKQNEYYVDIQVRGPFKSWKHKHSIIVHNDDVFLRDELEYETPFGFWGELANRLFISKKLNQIFAHREQVIYSMFPDLEGERLAAMFSDNYDV